MQGTVAQKMLRLVGNLARHPGYVPRYLSHNLTNGPGPLELEIPWIAYAAIDFLHARHEPNWRVFEFGSGGSTLFFARRVKSVLSVEDNPEWFNRVSQHLLAKKLANVTLKLCPFDVLNPVDFEHSAYLKALPDEPFDLILIDSSEAWTQVRPACFHLAESRIKPGGFIVLDDSWRYPALRSHHRARAQHTFQSVGPGRPGVTTTDIFFY